MVTSEQEGMAEGRLSSASEGAHLSAPPPSVQGADSEDSDPTYMSMSQTSEADVATGLTSEPVLRQAPTPRAVSFVEPGHRMSGYSSRVWTISDGHTLNTEQVARGESQLEARDFNLPSSSNSVDVGTSPLRLSCETAQPSQSRSLHYIQHKPPWAFRANGLPSLDYTIISRPKQKAPKLRWTAGFSHLWDRIWTPVGVLSVIYVLLIVAWGSALFVIMMGWTSLPLLLRFPWIEICSQVSQSHCGTACKVSFLLSKPLATGLDSSLCYHGNRFSAVAFARYVSRDDNSRLFASCSGAREEADCARCTRCTAAERIKRAASCHSVRESTPSEAGIDSGACPL